MLRHVDKFNDNFSKHSRHFSEHVLLRLMVEGMNVDVFVAVKNSSRYLRTNSLPLDMLRPHLKKSILNN